MGWGSQILAAISRIENSYGDRNLFCDCVPIGAYAAYQMTIQCPELALGRIEECPICLPG